MVLYKAVAGLRLLLVVVEDAEAANDFICLLGFSSGEKVTRYKMRARS